MTSALQTPDLYKFQEHPRRDAPFLLPDSSDPPYISVAKTSFMRYNISCLGMGI